MSYYLHHVPGRLRVKSPAVKGKKRVADEVLSLLKGIDGVDNVDVNLTTGSLLINYDPEQVHRDDIVYALHGNGYFDPSKATTNDQYIHNAASKFLSLVSMFI